MIGERADRRRTTSATCTTARTRSSARWRTSPPAPGATLVHCAAGKDRTGDGRALALAAVGVERDAIVADYVATGERIVAIMARLRASSTYAADLDDEPDESHAPRAETLERSSPCSTTRHGGPVGWLDGHGFDPAPAGARLRAA